MPTPRHKPTPKRRADVHELAALGLSVDRIGAIVGVGATTLREYYFDELHVGRSSAVQHYAQSLKSMSTQVDESKNATPQALAATIFALKTLGQWREKSTDIDSDFFEPSKAKPAKVREAVLAAYGNAASTQEVAALAGISVTELSEMRDTDPKFAAECDRASAMARARMEAVLRTAALNGDTGAARMWLERRHPDFHPETNRPASSRLASEDEAASTPFEYL